MVIQYKGEQHDTDNTSTNSPDVGFSINKNTPQYFDSFPVAEFRIINTRANELGCEIIDAKVSCLVCTNHSSEPPSTEPYLSNNNSRKEALDVSMGVNENVPLFQQKYHNLPCNAMSHPNFRRIWYLRHVLDGNSPLLKPEMKSKIAQCGYWPSEHNTHEAVRNSLVHFHDIVVNFRGTSSLSNSEVFAKKRYKYPVSSCR